MLPANALRLSALVAAAMASGYLWRGAVELREPAQVLQSAPPAIGFELPDAPFSSLAQLRLHGRRASVPVGQRQAAVRVTPRTISARRSGAAQLIAVVEAPPTSSVRARQSKHRSRAAQPPSKPPSNSRPKPPPPPPVPPPPPPPPEPPPPPPPPPPPAGVGTRPGRGNGDRNHTHTGPPGQSRPKKDKGEKGPQGDKGQKQEKGQNGQGKEKKDKK